MCSWCGKLTKGKKTKKNKKQKTVPLRTESGLKETLPNTDVIYVIKDSESSIHCKHSGHYYWNDLGSLNLGLYPNKPINLS